MIAIVAGLLVITRRMTREWVNPALQVQILGLVILLTGLLHMVGVVRLRRVRKGAEPELTLLWGCLNLFSGLCCLFRLSLMGLLSIGQL